MFKPDNNEDVWDQAHVAINAGDKARAIALFTKLSDLGDWRGSFMIGSIFDDQGKDERSNFDTAAHWYSRAVLQGDNYLPHYGLARYYYYGLGGKYDFKLASEHLKICVERVPDNQRQDAAEIQIMMAELLLLGFGTHKDISTARRLFSAAALVGYPAAVMGLSRIERAKKHYFKALLYFFRTMHMALKLVIENKDHPLLAGIGGRHRVFRRDWLRDKWQEQETNE